MDINIRIYELKIRKLKNNLRKTDYQAIKYAEGLLSEEEYAETKLLRETWRAEINRLELKLMGEASK